MIMSVTVAVLVNVAVSLTVGMAMGSFGFLVFVAMLLWT
jgi:hypothetical protein